MPASEVMKLYRQHKLHSGPGGPIVKTKKQATAIQISMARKEGHDIPEMQTGGIVPETGPVKLHSGEEVQQALDIAGRTRGAERNEWLQSMQGSAQRTPWDIMGGPEPIGSPHYAVEGLKGNVAERMRQQGEEASGLARRYREAKR